MSLSLHMKESLLRPAHSILQLVIDTFLSCGQPASVGYTAKPDNTALNAVATKTWSYKATRVRVGGGLCLLLFLLSSVGGSSDIDEMLQRDLLDPGQMIKALQLLGFSYSRFNSLIGVAPYIPNKCAHPISNINLALTLDTSNTAHPAPSYVITHFDTCLQFSLPNYPDAGVALSYLKLLKKIAVIRSDKLYTMDILYASANPNCRQENLRILSRLINLLDSDNLCLQFDGNLDKEVGDIDRHLDICRKEAQNVLDHANYKKRGRIIFSCASTSSLPNLVYSGIVFLRPIVEIVIEGHNLRSINLVSRLPLAEGYTIYLQQVSGKINIAFEFLQPPAPRCHQIAMEDYYVPVVTLTGLDNAIAAHPEIVLKANWTTLQYLGKYNIASIRVHTIIGFEGYESYEQDQSPLPSHHEHTHVEARISAIKAIAIVSADMICRPKQHYRQIYNKALYAKYGISVKECEIIYDEDRDDLDQTISLLYKLGGLSAKPTDVITRAVHCLGETLNNPNWVCHKPVSIRLKTPQFIQNIQRYKRHSRFFCQNIRYTSIEIFGSVLPYIGQIEDCMAGLSLFHNITAERLTICNVRATNQLLTNFNLATMQIATTDPPSWYLKLKVLVLDNVDEHIIYWVLGNYNFVGSIDVYILNQRFTNLAIVQILSLPIAYSIASLVLNNVLDLDEAKHCLQLGKIKDFSVFRYIEEARESNQARTSLGIHKLLLAMFSGEEISYSDVLSKFLAYGIRYQVAALESYITHAVKVCDTALSLDYNWIKLFGLTLAALKADLARCLTHAYALQNTTPAPPTPSTTRKYFATKLFLHFSNSVPLIEANLSLILRWVFYRFLDLNTLRLANVKISEPTRIALEFRDYLVVGNGIYKVVRLHGRKQTNYCVNMQIQPYHTIRLINVASPTPAAAVVASEMLPQILGQDLKQINPKTSLHKFVKYLRTHINQATCPACLRDLYLPDEIKTQIDEVMKMLADKEKQADRIEPTSEIRKVDGLELTDETRQADSNQDDPPTKKQRRCFNETDNFTTLCYLQCGHFVCSVCILSIQPPSRCPICRSDGLYCGIHQLRYGRLPNIALVEDNSMVPASILERFTFETIRNQPTYFYILYGSKYQINTDFDSKTTNDLALQFYVICL
ncbi:hypothetical protein NEHOM01_2269 [Nematocida homosporus]|uniref:uncharacterized protein n=1 Tax=Nematocida homosporus TaxID=1912981 RepID=UPI00221FCFBD|nr:uncharacterized protein NEHOM01_2269 [Nematocida homosporus]KAI5187557.1 hypothetical protein NEHOM01_2269 [Nematocida homosporus]